MSKILIVDDEPDVREFLGSYLKKHQYETLTARNSQEAIEAITQESPPIVFCGLVKPERKDTTGLDILSQAKRLKPDIIFYIIMNPDREIEQKALYLGAQEVLIKPVLPEDIENKIKEVSL